MCHNQVKFEETGSLAVTRCELEEGERAAENEPRCLE